MKKSHNYTVIEICAGAGGQALGLEKAGFETVAAVEIDSDACDTLRQNRPSWNVKEIDIHDFNGKEYKGIDLLAGGVPCPPFSIAGKQLGKEDERDLFPQALRLVDEIRPSAVMLENVRGFATKRFFGYRQKLFAKLAKLGYKVAWKVLNASDFQVPQLRPRFILVALHPKYASFFQWPDISKKTVTVAEVIGDLMLSRGWEGGEAWLKKANDIGPTIVGGSKKHGGPDLGPTRAKRQWAELGVDGHGIANEPPGPDFPGDKNPRLTNRMVARIQGFPDEWKISGKKTASYRQIGNAFPSPVARAIGRSILGALNCQKHKFQARGQLDLFGPFEPIFVEDLHQQEPVRVSGP